MKQLLTAFTPLVLTLTACAPATAQTPGPRPMPRAGAQAVALAATDPTFSATAMLGRPTATSVTVNVVPTAALSVFYEYGTASGVYTARTATQAAATGVPIDSTPTSTRAPWGMSRPTSLTSTWPSAMTSASTP